MPTACGHAVYAGWVGVCNSTQSVLANRYGGIAILAWGSGGLAPMALARNSLSLRRHSGGLPGRHPHHVVCAFP